MVDSSSVVILNNKMDIYQIYNGNVVIGKPTTDPEGITITIPDDKNAIIDPQPTVVPTDGFVIIYNSQSGNIDSAYKFTTIKMDGNTFTLTYVPSIIGQKTVFENDITTLCANLTSIQARVLKLFQPDNNSSNTLITECKKTNLYTKSIELIEKFNKLVNSIIYNNIIVKLISVRTNVFDNIELEQTETETETETSSRITLDITGIVKKITNVEYEKTLFKQINELYVTLTQNKTISQGLKPITIPKDVRELTYLLNTLGTYLEENNSSVEVTNFKNNVVSYVNTIIENKLLTYETLYIINDTPHDINEFIRLVNMSVNSKKIDTEYLKDSNTRLITYIKINNTESNSVIDSLIIGGKITYRYNERFNILIDNTTYSSMIVQYNSHDIKYYDDNLTQFSDITTQPKTPPSNNYYNKSTNSIDLYDYTYKYGHFSKIFTPNNTNSDISKEMNEVITMLDNDSPKPVFIIGYGSSGAGKTSSLIYFNKGEGDQKDGVLVWLLKRLCENDRYNKVEFYIKEFSNRTYEEIVRTPANDTKIIYNYTDGKFSISNYDDINDYITGKEKRNKYRTAERKIDEQMAVFKQEIPEEQKPALDFVDSGINPNVDIGDILIRLIDTNRFVKATTNNPNSSRSHVVVYVKLSNQDGNTNQKHGYMYIGDFAGVENKFGCENPSNVIRFLNIPRDNEKNIIGESMKNSTRYYNTEPDTSVDTGYMFGGDYDATVGLDEKYLNGKIDEIDRGNLTSKTKGNVILTASEMYNMLGYKSKSITEFAVDSVTNGNMQTKLDNIRNDKKLTRTYTNIITLGNTIGDNRENLVENIAKKTSFESMLVTNPQIKDNIKNFVLKLLNVDNNGNTKSHIEVKINFDETLKKHIPANKNPEIVKNFNILISKILGLNNNVNSGMIPKDSLVYNNTTNVNLNDIKNCLIETLSNTNTNLDNSMFKCALQCYENPILGGKTYFEFQIKNETIQFKIMEKCAKTSDIDIIFGDNNSITYEVGIGQRTGSDKNIYTIFIKKVSIVITKGTEQPSNIVDLLYSNTSYSLKQENTVINSKLSVINTTIESLTSSIEPTTKDFDKKFSNLIQLYNSIRQLCGYSVVGRDFVNSIINTKSTGGQTQQYNKSVQLRNTKPTQQPQKQPEPQVSITNEIGNIDIEKLKNVYNFVESFFNLNMDQLSPNFTKLVDAVSHKYNKGKTACENRQNEGDYINKTLSDIRKTIDEIMVAKNENKFIAPAFIYECYEQYCPSAIDCFKPKQTSQTSSIPSNIFKSIYDDMNYQDKTQFYKDLLVCVFCVFNIARSANNPPVSRYIDINELKYFVATSGKTFESKSNVTIGKDNNASVENAHQNFKNIIGRIAKNIDYKYKDNNNNTYEIIDNAGLLSYAVSNPNHHKYILADLQAYIDSNKQTAIDIIHHILEYIKKSKIIETIDNYNAASTIGTLDFADRFAKMNMVENTCTIYNLLNNSRAKIQSDNKYKQLTQEQYHQFLSNPKK